VGNGERFDAIVLGVGGMGSSAVFHLARRGKRVIGLERFDVLHPFGSSHGLNRIIRLAYSEHPSYVPLLRRAYELWHELEDLDGRQLLFTTGNLEGGLPDGGVIEGAVVAAELHDLPHEVLSGAEASRRWPAYHLPDDFRVLFQPDGGFVASEDSILAHVRGALANGAEIHWRESVLEWGPSTEGGVWVQTDRGRYEADRLVISAGAWAGRLVPGLAELAVPERQVLAWLQPTRPELFALGAMPVFLLQVEEGRYYGFPEWGIPGFKFGRFHHLEERVDPDAMDREPNDRDEEILRAFARRYFPDGEGPTVALKACLFTNTPDEHFILDVHPDFPQVAVAAGFSGHGFKFCSVVGQIMADLVEGRDTGFDLDLFRWDRFSAAGGAGRRCSSPEPPA
jgi:sarcosine oxidase